MPIYEYECTSCGHRFEVMQGFESPKPTCPSCGSQVHQVFGSYSFYIKSKIHPEDKSLHQEPGGHWMKDE